MELCLSPAETPASKQILTPAQQEAAEGLSTAMTRGNLLVLQGDIGLGKTTVLKHVQANAGGVLLGMLEFMQTLEAREPFAVEEAWLRLMEVSLANYDIVFLDDMHLISKVVEGYSYPRQSLLDVAITAVLELAGSSKKLVFAVEEDISESISRRAETCKIGDCEPQDYQSICSAYLGITADSLDYERIHRFAPGLTAHQLKTACACMRGATNFDTDGFIEYLVSHNLSSNVQIKEVEAVDWNDLKGVDDVIRALEAKIAFPLEDHRVAAEFQLKPKRGVLLAGPPGTGKTTIGRALAHRLKSKFFLIDGTVIAGTNNFYCEIKQIFLKRPSATRRRSSLLTTPM